MILFTKGSRKASPNRACDTSDQSEGLRRYMSLSSSFFSVKLTAMNTKRAYRAILSATWWAALYCKIKNAFKYSME